MYEWLEKEISQIKARDFHVVEPHRSDELKQLPNDLYLKLPPSYLEFVARFGAARLYKRGEYYQVGVLSSPKNEMIDDEEVLRIGHFDDQLSYLKVSQLAYGKEAPVYERDEDLEEVAASFADWLVHRCDEARASYKENWEELWAGAKPFTPEEKAIVEARKKFEWRVVGVDDNGDLKISVANKSNMTLPYLSLGVIAKDNSLKGKMWLNVSQIKPGDEQIVTHPAYKELVPSDKVLVEALPDPTPDEREAYWEFKK